MITLRRSAAVAAGALVLGAVAFTGAGTSSAATSTLVLTYNCPFPLIGPQDMTVTIVAEQLPDSAVVGQPIPEVLVTATAAVPPTATQGLSLVGATTVSGTAKADTVIDNAGFVLPVVPQLTIGETAVPASGSFDAVARGGAPSVTLPNAGTTTISVGNFSTTLTPRNASGGETGLGTFTSDCTLLPGQNTLLHTFPVTAGGTTDPTTTTTTATTTTTTGATTTTTSGTSGSTTTGGSTTTTSGTGTTTTGTTTFTTTTAPAGGGGLPDDSDRYTSTRGVSRLASTGASLALPLGLAALLLVAGATVLLLQRRRRRS
jgi:hypothetical protein